MKSFKTVTVKLFDEEQVYVVESNITEAHIAAGNEEGVVCHMVDATKAELIVTLLNERDVQRRTAV